MIVPGARRAAARLAAECLLAAGARRDALPDLARGAGPRVWSALLGLAEGHAVAETIHLGLDRHGCAEAAPEPVRSALREAHEGAAARNTLLLAEATRLQDALAAAGILTVLLKGTALVAAHLSTPGARHVADVDVLVAPADLARADAIAREAGCVPLAAASQVRLDGGAEGAHERHHLPALVTRAGVVVELHGRPGHAPLTGRWTAGFLERSRRVAWQGGAVRVPAPADLLAGLCAHLAHGHAGDRRFLPRHLADLAVLEAAGVPLEAAAELPGAADAVEASRALLAAARRGEAGALFETAASRLVRRAAALRSGLRRARSQGGPVRYLFPARAYMERRYPAAGAGTPLALLHARRLARGAWRLVSGR